MSSPNEPISDSEVDLAASNSTEPIPDLEKNMVIYTIPIICVILLLSS